MSEEVQEFKIAPSLVPTEILDYAMDLPQVNLPVEHFIYEGVYYRTVRVPKDVVIVGAILNIPTTVIISGNCVMGIGNTSVNLKGYHVFKGSKYRQQVFRALEETCITMIFRTDAKTVEDAEKEMTGEWNLLQNNINGDNNL